MRTRGFVAAGAGIAVAGVAHALDATGRLPFVHESASVRLAMSPAQMAVWLLAAGVLAGVAASTRRMLGVGVPAAVVVSAAPELLARHDPGAIAEPGALLGAALQLLLLAIVVLAAAAFERRAPCLVPQRLHGPAQRRPVPFRRRGWSAAVDAIAAPRAPPCVECS